MLAIHISAALFLSLFSASSVASRVKGGKRVDREKEGLEPSKAKHIQSKVIQGASKSLSELFKEQKVNAMCDADAGCGTASGGSYTSPQTCTRYASARGCSWLPDMSCCGRADQMDVEMEDGQAPRSQQEQQQYQQHSHFCQACNQFNLGDTDRDGIPDCMESPGCFYYGLPLYQWGARPGVRDIFVEVDWMASPPGDEGVTPRAEAFAKVVEAFTAASVARSDVEVAVHFDVGQMGGGNEVPYMPTLCPEGADQFATIEAIRVQHQDLIRRTIFYYMLFASSINPTGDDGASGGSRIRGTLVYVTLGGWGLTSSQDANKNLLINSQAATLMHELGHALGLRHGGADNTMNKPNYISTMNYLYMLSGLPQIGQPWEGDRWYLDNEKCQRHICPSDDCSWDQLNQMLHAGPYTSDFQIGYSHGNANPIDERSLLESGGLGNHPNDAAVDFDCDGRIFPEPRFLIVHQCIDDVLSRFDPGKPDQTDACGGKKGTSRKATVLHDHDDWGNLFLFFGEAYNPDAVGLNAQSYLAMLQQFAHQNGIFF